MTHKTPGDTYIQIRLVRSHAFHRLPKYHRSHAHQLYWGWFVVLFDPHPAIKAPVAV